MPRSLLRLNLTMGDARTVLLASNRRRNVKESPAEAAVQFERELGRDPVHVPSLIELGRAQRTLGLPVRAVETLQAALHHDRRTAEAHALLARAGQGRQLPTRALEAISPTTPRSRRWPRSIGRSPSIRPSPGPPRLRGDINAKLNGGKTP
jgi:hypothetical protein